MKIQEEKCDELLSEVSGIGRLMMCKECERLKFMRERDGSAIAFARQVVTQYRKSVLQSKKRGFGRNGQKIHHASLPEYRRGFIESYLVAKRYKEQPNV